jgi:hypothetical protein
MRPISTRDGAAGILAVLAASALALSGCSGSSGGGGNGNNGGSGTSSVQPGPGGGTSGSGGARSGGGSYSDSSAVLSALKSAGHPCTPLSGGQGADLKAPGLRSVTSCAIGSSGSGTTSNAVTATVFDNHTDAQTYATLLTSANSSGLLVSGTSQRAVLGQNWVVLVPDDTAYVNQVSTALGGTVLGGASSASAG